MEEEQVDRTIIVKRTELSFNDLECQVINFTEITTYKKLEQARITSRLLRALNASAHHEMLGPLRANIDISTRLIRQLKDEELKRMSQTILISSQLVLLHANDLLDSQSLQNFRFIPAYQPGSVETAIFEIVELVWHTLQRKKIKIKCFVQPLKQFPVISFDRRRLQQVLLNLLSNAVKFMRKGEIQVDA